MALRVDLDDIWADAPASIYQNIESRMIENA
jgi:hypothetical protein